MTLSGSRGWASIGGLSLALAACGPTSVSPPPTTVAPQPMAASPQSMAASAPTAPQATAPVAPVPPTDPRRFATSPRRAELLVRELQQLLALLDVTTRAAPDRPALVRRLAETGAELVYAADAEQKPQLHEVGSRTALDRYAELHEAAPSDPRDDEVLFFLGLEQLRAGRADNAANTFATLRRLHADSRFAAMVPR